jgi:hypothetical protein
MEVYMWECKICRRILEDEDLTCWSCGGKREDVGLTQDQDDKAQFKEAAQNLPMSPDSSQDKKSVNFDPEKLAKEKEKYKNLPTLSDKLKYFAEKLSADDALDSRIIKENLVISKKWVVINSSLIMDILESGVFSDNPIHVCVYSSDTQILVFTEQGLVVYSEGEFHLFDYGYKIPLEIRFPMEVRIEMESFQSCFPSQNEQF